MNRSLLYLSILPLLLIAPGCVEDVWLPDSSGLVCITLDHTLVHYDLAKKTERVIAKHDWLHSEDDAFERAGVSPDSKRVALVRHVSSKDTETVQFLIYDLATAKEVLKTKEIALPGHAEFSPTPLVRSGAVFWSPDGRRLLFDVTAPLFRDGKPIGGYRGDPERSQIATMGFYDLETKKHQFFTTLSLDEETVAMGLSPFSPDNRGFLAGRIAKEQAKPDSEAMTVEAWNKMVFVDWSGREHTFKVAPEVIEASDKERRDSQRRSGQSDYRTDVPHCRWEKGVCVMQLEKGLARIDTAKLTITYEPDAACARRLQYAEKNKIDVMGWKDDLLVQFREVEEGGAAAPADPAAAPDAQPPAKPIDVELLSGMDWKTGKAAKVVKAIRVDDIETAVISPDGEYLLLRAAVDGPEGARIRRVVINAKGEKVLDAAEKTPLKRFDPGVPPPAPPVPAPPAPPKPGVPKPPEA